MSLEPFPGRMAWSAVRSAHCSHPFEANPHPDPVLDSKTRRIKNRALGPLARVVARLVSPGTVTFASLVAGLGAAWAALEGAYGGAVLLFAANRVLDGVDGMVAREAGRQSDLGGYLDILADFVVYAAIPVGLVLGRPSGEAPYLAAIVLFAAFYLNAASWMYLAAILEKRGWSASSHTEPGSRMSVGGRARPSAGADEDARAHDTSVVMPDAIIGGTESILFFAAFLFFPAYLEPLFWVMAALLVLSVGQRVLWAARELGE